MTPSRKEMNDFHRAVVNNKDSCFEYVEKYPDFLDVPGRAKKTALMRAAELGHISIARKLVEKGADVNAQDRFGKTALMDAAFGAQNATHPEWSGQKEIVVLLLAHGANIHAVDREGMSPLTYAAYGGDPEIVDLLLENGADTLQRTNSGDTARDWAYGQAHPKALALLEQWPEKLRRREAAKELAAEVASFSTTLTRPIPAPQKLKKILRRGSI